MQSRGPIVVALLLAALVALALAFPATSPRSVTGTTASGADGAGATARSALEGERERIHALVREYLLDNPEVIVEAMERLESRERTADARRSAAAIAADRAALLEADGDPFLGPADAAVVMVEFFDYQCPYCKRVAGDLAALADENSDLKIVFKEFPIFGEPSMLAARAALAADRQGKYREFHRAMMALRSAPSQAVVERTASQLGIDLERFRNDLDSPEIAAALAANRALAERIGVRGTPAFVIGDRLIPGAIDKARMQELVAGQRGG